MTTIPSAPETPPPKPPSSEKTTTSKSKQKGANATVNVSHLYAVRILSRKYTTSARRKVSPSCDIMEPFLQRGIYDYERLHGPVKPKRKKGVDSILN